MLSTFSAKKPADRIVTRFAGYYPKGRGNEVSHLTNGLTTPFVALVGANWQRFGNIKLFKKVRAN